MLVSFLTTSRINLNSFINSCTFLKSPSKVDQPMETVTVTATAAEANLPARANNILKALVHAEVEAVTTQLEYLGKVTEFLQKRKPKLVDRVEKYCENSHNINAALEKWLSSAKDMQLLSEEASERQYSRSLEELNKFLDAWDAFTREFLQVLESVYGPQKWMLETLGLMKNEVGKKLEYIRAGRMASGIIFAAGFAAGLICSVVAAATDAPPAVAAVAAVSSLPFGSIGKWIDYRFQKYDNDVKGQEGLIGLMNVCTYVTIKHLESIRVVTERFEIEKESLVQSVYFVINDDTGENVADEIKMKLGVLIKKIEELVALVDNCSAHFRSAGTAILQEIIKTTPSI